MTAPISFYFTPGCGYCVRARGLLERLQVPFEAINVAGDTKQRAWLREVTGRTTVPQIFIAGKSIGGCDDLFELHNAGKLQVLLDQAKK